MPFKKPGIFFFISYANFVSFQPFFFFYLLQREACGGHGYLKASNLGELRNNHDACVTYEGDNNVLGQQASNWLIRQWENGVESPAGTANFIKNRDEISSLNFEKILRMCDVKSFECEYKDKIIEKISSFSCTIEYRGMRAVEKEFIVQ